MCEGFHHVLLNYGHENAEIQKRQFDDVTLTYFIRSKIPHLFIIRSLRSKTTNDTQQLTFYILLRANQRIQTFFFFFWQI